MEAAIIYTIHKYIVKCYYNYLLATLTLIQCFHFPKYPTPTMASIFFNYLRNMEISISLMKKPREYFSTSISKDVKKNHTTLLSFHNAYWHDSGLANSEADTQLLLSNIQLLIFLIEINGSCTCWTLQILININHPGTCNSIGWLKCRPHQYSQQTLSKINKVVIDTGYSSQFTVLLLTNIQVSI